MTGHAAVTLATLAGAVLATSDVPGIVVGEAGWHRVAAGESVVSIAARVGLEPSTLAFDNDVRADRPLAAESWLLVDNRHIVPMPLDGIVVNVPQRMLHLAVDGRHVLSVPVAVGRADWPTPLGSFAVAMKEVDPTWDVPPSIQAEMAREGRPVVTRVAPGPRNPLGDRWIGLNASNLGIHGTNQPTSIYRFTTHGFIRARPDDIARLFPLVDVGTPVRVIYEPVLIAELQSGEVWLEVHRDPYRKAADRLGAARELLQAAGLSELASSPLVEALVRARRGRAERLR
jgi:L,D-transpeptidase ErfK/SrfK